MFVAANDSTRAPFGEVSGTLKCAFLLIIVLVKTTQCQLVFLRGGGGQSTLFGRYRAKDTRVGLILLLRALRINSAHFRVASFPPKQQTPIWTRTKILEDIKRLKRNHLQNFKVC